MDRIRDCQNNNQIRLLPFFVDGNVIGHISQDFARILAHFSDIFTVQSEQVFLARDLIGYAHRSSAIAQALQIMRNDGVISGWRDELYPVGTAFNKPPLFISWRPPPFKALSAINFSFIEVMLWRNKINSSEFR